MRARAMAFAQGGVLRRGVLAAPGARRRQLRYSRSALRPGESGLVRACADGFAQDGVARHGMLTAASVRRRVRAQPRPHRPAKVR